MINKNIVPEFEIPALGKFFIRPMLITDVPSVHAVEVKAYTCPWSAKLMHDCVLVGYDCWLVEFQSQVIGYSIYRLALGEAHLFNIAVAPEYHNKGIGRKFLSFLINRIQDSNANNIIMEVRVSNYPARKLYSDFGFIELGIRKGYYPNPDGSTEDGINLELVFSKAK